MQKDQTHFQVSQRPPLGAEAVARKAEIEILSVTRQQIGQTSAGASRVDARMHMVVRRPGPLDRALRAISAATKHRMRLRKTKTTPPAQAPSSRSKTSKL
jgi:hypothetical protein